MKNIKKQIMSPNVDKIFDQIKNQVSHNTRNKIWDHVTLKNPIYLIMISQIKYHEPNQ